jgi:hypothetical protein
MMDARFSTARQFCRIASDAPQHPPPRDTCCQLRSPQLNADNVTKPLPELRFFEGPSREIWHGRSE